MPYTIGIKQSPNVLFRELAAVADDDLAGTFGKKTNHLKGVMAENIDTDGLVKHSDSQELPATFLNNWLFVLT